MSKIFFKGLLPYSFLAGRLKDILKIPYEKRYGANVGGGEYYLYRALGLEIYLIRNKGEVEIPERRGWKCYLWIETRCTENASMIEATIRYLAALFKAEGLTVEVDD